jgi:NAD(P)-dependent dehydrogenase (short-subunit alcohol dehydrogenase family)
MDPGLTGKTVLITGASQGIGAGLANAFAEEGCHLRLTARNVEKLASVKAKIEADHPASTTRIFPGDLTTTGAVERLAGAVGDVDILVNNAGVIPSGSLFDIDEQKAAGGGVIINNIGNGGEISDPRYIAGSVGNASLMAFTRAIVGQSLDDNIRIVGVNPGPVDTNRIYNMLRKRAKDLFGDETRYKELLERCPLRRPAHVREIADLVVFLASYRSGYTSGAIMAVDGGIACRRSIV